MFKKILFFVLLFNSSQAWSEDGTISLTTGFDLSSGKYGGNTTTNILYIPVIGKYQTDTYYLKFTVPYISMSSSSGVVPGFGPAKRSLPSTNVVTQQGMGDVTASAGYTVYEDDALLFDLVGNIKLGTADPAKNLGTGKNDYSAQVDGFYTLNKTTLFTTVGYKIVGAPEGVTVNNVLYGSLGFSQKTGENTSAGVAFDAAQSSSEGNPGRREGSFFVSNKLSKNLKIQFNLLKGFSDSSPDFGGGIMLTGTLE